MAISIIPFSQRKESIGQSASVPIPASAEQIFSTLLKGFKRVRSVFTTLIFEHSPIHSRQLMRNTVATRHSKFRITAITQQGMTRKNHRNWVKQACTAQNHRDRTVQLYLFADQNALKIGSLVRIFLNFDCFQTVQDLAVESASKPLSNIFDKVDETRQSSSRRSCANSPLCSKQIFSPHGSRGRADRFKQSLHSGHPGGHIIHTNRPLCRIT